MKRKWWLLVLLAVAVVVIGIYPYESTVVPAWRFKVIDESGQPYVEEPVTQSWKHDTYDLEPGGHYETRHTDRDGYVFFPERTIRISLLKRVFLTMYGAVMAVLAHGSLGIESSVMITGEWIKYYKPGEPLPEQIIIPRDN